MMKRLPGLAGLLLLGACGGIPTEVTTEVTSEGELIVGVLGHTVHVHNQGPGAVRVIRHAPSGEPVGTSRLEPGESWSGTLEILRHVGLRAAAGHARVSVSVTGARNGRSAVRILGRKP